MSAQTQISLLIENKKEGQRDLAFIRSKNNNEDIINWSNNNKALDLDKYCQTLKRFQDELNSKEIGMSNNSI
jgi:hypothetical protein